MNEYARDHYGQTPSTTKIAERFDICRFGAFGYLAVSFDRFGKVMQPEGEASITLLADMKGATAGVIGANGSVTPAQESNGTLKRDFAGSPVIVLKGN